MSADDDDLGGDDQLKQLRSVWVSMRESDEDPPDRGLDALMVAARTKAADMAPPATEGFWAKVLAAFRRPPVLALASITVLLGGGLFIAQRRASMQSEQTVSERQQDGAGSAAPAMPERAPDPDPAPAPAAATPPPEAVATPAVPPQESAPTRQRPSGPRRAPANVVGKPPEPTVDAKKPAKADDEGGEDAPSGTAAVGGAVASDPEPVKAQTTRGAVPKPPQAATVTETLGRSETELAIDADRAAPAKDRASTQVTQLVKQCESAAVRNDCAAVRVLASKIKSADAAAYKQRVANNAAIARCLAE